MSRPKHTPGPWTLCAHLRDIDKEIDCGCGYRGVIFGPESAGFGYAICQPGHEPAPPGQEGTEPPRYDRMTEIANAHLIAAAPDLLEASGAVDLADALDKIVKGHPTLESAEDQAIYDLGVARAALARYRGEQ